MLRGIENGTSVENVYKVDTVEQVIDPFTNYNAYVSLAKAPAQKIIVSNTTEAGICYNGEDQIDGFDSITLTRKRKQSIKN